jgi:hypothetical protein
VAEAKLYNTVYSVYTWSAVCTVQLIYAWCQDGLSIGFIDYSLKRRTHRVQTHKHDYRVCPELTIYVAGLESFLFSKILSVLCVKWLLLCVLCLPVP